MSLVLGDSMKNECEREGEREVGLWIRGAREGSRVCRQEVIRLSVEFLIVSSDRKSLVI